MPRILIIALLAAVLPPMSAAQMRGRPGIAAGGHGFRHLRSGGFGYPLFYADYGMESTTPPPPQPVVVEKRVFQPEARPEPVLIEWHGDRFVRYGGAATGAQSPDYAVGASTARGSTGPEVIHEMPPAVLVYRDGHREEVRDYVITRGVLYVRGDGYSSASRNVQLSALDLSATFQVNQDSGVRFMLPAGPNEVVTRP